MKEDSLIHHMMMDDVISTTHLAWCWFIFTNHDEKSVKRTQLSATKFLTDIELPFGMSSKTACITVTQSVAFLLHVISWVHHSPPPSSSRTLDVCRLFSDQYLYRYHRCAGAHPEDIDSYIEWARDGPQDCTRYYEQPGIYYSLHVPI